MEPKKQPGTLKNYKKTFWHCEKPAWIHEKVTLNLENQPGTLKIENKPKPLKICNNRHGTMKNQSATIKTNPELYRVVMGGSGGYRRLPGGSAHFS